MREQTIKLIHAYYDAFNRSDWETFFSLMTDDVIHDINQGQREIGKDLFKKFMNHMEHSYKEKVTDLLVLVNDDGSRAATEFMVEGQYLATDPGFPEARRQTYKLAAGAFLEIKNNQVARLTNYYNVKEWIKLVSK